MLNGNPHAKEQHFTFRVDAKLKEDFQQATRASDLSSAYVLRSFMRSYIKRRNAQRFTEEARRHSLIITEAARRPDSDEARIMHELEEGLYYFNEQ